MGKKGRDNCRVQSVVGNGVANERDLKSRGKIKEWDNVWEKEMR